jgi:hypothetical protein
VARVLPVVVALILTVYALIDCLQTDSSRLRALNKFAWLAIIVLIPVIGPILWLAIAKIKTQPSRPTQRPAQPLPPDDNPEFLRELRNLDEEHEKLLNEWEENLRRREQDLRKDDESPGEKEPKRDDNAEEELRRRGDGGEDDSR